MNEQDDITLIKRRLAPTRTLQGAHGERFWNIPGVVYPAEALATHKPKQRTATEPPKGWLTAREVGRLFGVTTSCARGILIRHKVRHVLIRDGRTAPYNAYEPRAVRALAASKAPITDEPPAEHVDSAEACGLLGCGRGTLFRLVHAGQLPELKIRLQDDKTIRVRSYYPTEAVMDLAARRAQFHAAYAAALTAYKTTPQPQPATC